LVILFSKLIEITALLITARSVSRPGFLASAFYMAVIFIISMAFSKETRRYQTEVFDDGRIVEDGSHEELLKKQGLYARMYRAAGPVVSMKSRRKHGRNKCNVDDNRKFC